jgi:hypothetical protein
MCVVRAAEVGDEVVDVLARKGQPPSRAGMMIIASRVACLARALGYCFFSFQ